MGHSRRGGRGGSGRPFSPLVLSPYIWLEADSGITESSNRISAWASKVNGVTLTQPTGAFQPLYTAADASYNNRPTVNIDDIARYLSIGGLSLTFPFSTFLYGDYAGAGLYGPGYLGAGSLYTFTLRSGSDMKLYANDGVAALETPTIADAASQKRSLYYGFPVSKDITVTRNASTTVVANNNRLPTGGTMNELYIGFTSSLSNNGRHAAYFHFTRELAPHEVAKLHAWCVAKYG